jgi:hypothetical protein
MTPLKRWEVIGGADKGGREEDRGWAFWRFDDFLWNSLDI